jgi:hypothetical protein
MQQGATSYGTNFEIADLRSVGAEAGRIFETTDTLMMVKWKNGIFPTKIEARGGFRIAVPFDRVVMQGCPRHPMQSSPQRRRGRIAILSS